MAHGLRQDIVHHGQKACWPLCEGADTLVYSHEAKRNECWYLADFFHVPHFYSARNHNKWDGGVHTWCRSSLLSYTSVETHPQTPTRVHGPADFRYCEVSHHNSTPCQLDTHFNLNLPTLVLKVRGHLIIKDTFSPSLSVPKLSVVLKIFFKKILP